MRYPMLKPESGTMLLVRDVPRSLYLKEKEKLGNAISLSETSQEEDRIESLKNEKEILLQRLAEIERLLSESSN